MKRLLAILGIGVSTATFVALPVFAGENLLINGGFEGGSEGWHLPLNAQIDLTVARHGANSLRLTGGSAHQDIQRPPADAEFTCTASIKTRGVRATNATGYAYIAVYQLDDFGDLVAARDFCQTTGSIDWQTHSWTFKVEKDCHVVSVRCGFFQATGTVWFDSFTLVAGPKGEDWEQTVAGDNVVIEGLGLGQRGTARAAVYTDDIPSSGASSSPAHLAGVLERAGLDVAFLNSDQLADRRFLNRRTFDLLVLPYGASFPVRAAENFRRYLRAGGKFISTGGYAFDNLLERSQEGWRKASSPVSEELLNTSRGRPEDGLETRPDQLGVFQPDYPLERVAFGRAAPDQCIVSSNTRIDEVLKGFAACGVVGFDRARWVPLVNAYDAYGRLRGAAGALLRHYAGPYAGSSWAFFGVTNIDLFAPRRVSMNKALGEIALALAEDTYIAALVPDPACVRRGESVRLLAKVANGGRSERQVRLDIRAYAGAAPGCGTNAEVPGNEQFHTTANKVSPQPRAPAAVFGRAVTIAPGQTNIVCIEWAPAEFEADFYGAIGSLHGGDRELDRIESGFVVWDEQTVASGPTLAFRDNYLRFRDNPLFLFGTDDWSYVLTTDRETPSQWLRDMRQRRDLGVLVYENLQVGQYFEHLPINRPANRGETKRLSRKIDGLVQLAQRHGQVYFPCLLCGYNVAVSDAELSRHRDFCRAYAERYARVPGLVYYLNGDLRCRLSEDVTPQWNDFLRERYGDTTRLRAAWGSRAPAQELGAIPAEDFQDWGHAWDDIKVYDQNLFRAWLIRRWTSTLIGGIRQRDTIHPATCEFYQLPHEGVDIPAAIGDLDISNFGYFERPGIDMGRFPAISKFNDQRARGKSFGPGEYGVKTHPAWGDGKDYGYHTARTREQAIDLFLAVAHYTFGLGGSHIHNWCWKDDAHRVFPWGMVWPCDGVPKDTAYVHRNQSLLFRHFRPVYREPAVYVLTADMHRMGGEKWKVIEGILEGFNIALATHIENLGTLNDCALNIPRSARVILYPLPFCVPDDAYAKLQDWVRRGGVLYLSGDCSYDEFRCRTQTRRLEELCGVRFLRENYPNIAVNATNSTDQPCIQVEPAGATVRTATTDGVPLVLEHRLGDGLVVFNADPIELHSAPSRRERDVGLYGLVLATGGVNPVGIEPEDASVHLFRVPMQDGGTVWVLFNFDETQPMRMVTLTGITPHITLTVARRRPALLWLDKQGAMLAVETQGDLLAGDDSVLSDRTCGIILALDEHDIRRSNALLLMPHQGGNIRVMSSVVWHEPLVETGEFQNGAWCTLERSRLRPSRGELVVEVQPKQVLSLLLVCEERDVSRWQKALSEKMINP